LEDETWGGWMDMHDLLIIQTLEEASTNKNTNLNVIKTLQDRIVANLV
jgi:hypothetical protein